MGEVAKLIGDGTGKLDTTLYDRTAPTGAWTHDITDAAAK
jgi:NitT/TauT family transport system substrate-binding protein